MENDEILSFLKNLETRIARIEAYLNLYPESVKNETLSENSFPFQKSGKDLEFEIGQNWFAKAGIIILALGIGFLLTFPYQSLPPAAPALSGYLIVLLILALSYFWRNSFTLISRYLFGGGLTLFYFTTLRLFFFSAQPVLQIQSFPGMALLSLVTVINLFVSSRRKSVYLFAISLLMGYTTAIVINQSAFLFLSLILLGSLTVYHQLKHDWHFLPFYGIGLCYLTHFIWALNNPVLGNGIQLVPASSTTVFFLLTYALIYSAGILFRKNREREDLVEITNTVSSGLISYLIYFILTIPLARADFVTYHLLASAIFLGLAILFWVREKSKYSTFIYAMLGYTALSIAIVKQFKSPDLFIWLSMQSLVVVSTAIWFRSRFIVVANFIIYLMILTAYLLSASVVNWVSLSFGVVALLSARIMNWQKDRLELKTEFMRNAYLTSAFFVFPYALYRLVPAKYVGLSWVFVALVYYLLNRIIKQQKYLWMGHFTLFLTVLYILIIGIIRLEPAYRIVSFLVLGIVLLAVSIIYNHLRTRNEPRGERH